MTPEEINKAVMLAVGWTIHAFETCGMKDVVPLPPGVPPTGENLFKYCSVRVPDYYSDLNACAEMEATLRSKEDKEEYAIQISGLFPEEFCDLSGTHEWIWAIARLTAPQRCEAFLRTKGMWAEKEGVK